MASAVQVQVDVHSLRSAQLQIELKRRGLSSSGKKSELRRRLEEALNKEREKAAANNAVPADNAEGSNTQPVQNTAKDSSTSEVTTAADTVSVNDKEETLNKDKTSTDIVTDKKTVGSAEDQPGNNNTACQDIKETSQDPPSQDITAQQEVTTQQEAVEDKDNPQSAAEVSMEVDELVVHTIDEDDFKIEEQSRSQVSKRKSGELPSGGAEERGESDTPAVKRRKINLQGSVGTPSNSSERKRKWKSSSSKPSATSSISSDVLKKIIPDSVTKEVTSEDVLAESDKTRSHDLKPDEVDTKTGDDEMIERERMRLAEEETRRRIEVRLKERQDGEQQQQQRRSDVSEGDLTANKEVIVDYNQAVRVRSPITNRNPASCVLHITNLVRPFAQCQLKELLTEDGPLVDGGFWINKIKSHCFAVYESLEVAIATRNRLDGVKWPVTNPKVLTVEFADEDKLVTLTDGALSVSSGVTAHQPHPPKPEEKPQQNTTVVKETAQTEQPIKQQEGEQDVTNKSAVNRLDELFKKTITTPQVYWLPLTSEEGEKRLAAIKAEEEERRQRREQRQKEREEKEKLAQEEREKRMKEREEERQQRRRRRSGSRRHSRSRSRHRSHSRDRRSR